MRVYVHACVCACVRACVYACVCVCVRVFEWIRLGVQNMHSWSPLSMESMCTQAKPHTLALQEISLGLIERLCADLQLA